MDKLHTLHEVATLLRLSAKTILRYIEDDKIKAFKFGNRWRIKSSEVERFINERENTGGVGA